MNHFNRLCTVILCSLSLNACMKHPSLAPELRPMPWGTLLSATHNFYQISPDVFRSEQPSSDLVPLLKQHGISTVINLRARDHDTVILKHQGFDVVHIPIHTWAMNKQDMLKTMQAIQYAKQNNEKILIHCYHGSDRTGATIAMYRIIFEDWSIEDATKEMKQGGYGFHVIWKNINRLFEPKKIKWIQQQLLNPSSV